MAKFYKFYLLSCCTLFISMQFHWYGKTAQAYKQEKPTKTLFCKKKQPHNHHLLVTKKIHAQVSHAVELREQLEKLVLLKKNIEKI